MVFLFLHLQGIYAISTSFYSHRPQIRFLQQGIDVRAFFCNNFSPPRK